MIVLNFLITHRNHFNGFMQARVEFTALRFDFGHTETRKRITQFAGRIEAAESDATVLLLEFLSSWMRDHVSVADRMMGAYLRNYSRSHSGFARAS